MILDKEENLGKYKGILASLAELKEILGYPVTTMDSFECDKKHTNLFIVKKGTFKVAAGWRELPASKDVLGVSVVEEGSFALFLPGERFLITGEGKAIRYSLES